MESNEVWGQGNRDAVGIQNPSLLIERLWIYLQIILDLTEINITKAATNSRPSSNADGADIEEGACFFLDIHIIYFGLHFFFYNFMTLKRNLLDNKIEN